MEGAGPKILGSGAKFKRVPCQKNCGVNQALICRRPLTVFSLSGGNRLNLPPQATASNSSYRLQPLDGLLKLYKLFYKNTGQELSITCWAKT